MIHFRMVGQFANQCLMYCLARILSDRTGLAYRAPLGFKMKSGEPVQWSGEPLFTMRDAVGVRADGIPQVIDAWQWFDIGSLDPRRPVIVRQWFGQRYEILKPYKDRIRNDWLRIAPERFVETDPEAVYIHVRRTDYVEYMPNRPADPMLQGTATSMMEFARCLNEFPDAKRVVIVTDADDDWIQQNMERLGQNPTWLGLPATVQSRAWDIDFLTLASARWLILSQSTFSWLAAFLGRAEKVVCSVKPGTFWGNGVGLQGPQTGPGGRDFPNLYVDDEPGRWVWLTGDA